MKRNNKSDNENLLAQETRLDGPPKHQGELRFHLHYPNSYWIAMSNLGFQAVYRVLSSMPAVAVDRGFLPDEELQGREKWRTFECSRVISDCDILGFSLSFETDYPNLLKVLNNLGLLYKNAALRDEGARVARGYQPLIIAGGTAVTLNPEPVADLLDLIVLGEAEELLHDLIAVTLEGKRQGWERTTLLKKLANVEGIYVPRFYTPQYYVGGALSGVEKESDVPARPLRRFVKNISDYPAYSSILTPETEFRSMFLTEIGRGCEMGCRFCVAGYIYRPIRKRSEDSIQVTVEKGLKATDAIGFVGAAVSSHRSISKLASGVARQGARASLSSIMAQRVTPELAASLSESEYKTVALAPEAGSERLRRAAGKRVSNDRFVEAARELAKSGIKGFKLYFIVGLPTEEDSDTDEIAQLSLRVRDAVVDASGGTGWVVLSVNPFIPKANTPFQWEPMMDLTKLDDKVDRIRFLIKDVSNIEMHFEPPKESAFQALLSRGDRRVGEMLVAAEIAGQDWKWILRMAKKPWLKAVPTLDFYVTRRIPFQEFLPWEVVDSRISRELLMREALRAREGEDEKLTTEVTEDTEGAAKISLPVNAL